MSPAAGAFDLIEQPWLPVRDLAGRSAERGLRTTLCRAHEIRDLHGDLPTQTFALTRILLAVLGRAVGGPRDMQRWRALWEAPTLPADLITSYLHQHRHRFDLIHPDTPFLQVADLRTTSGKASALTALIADIPNGVPYFVTRTDASTLSYAEAARWLVHAHAYDPTGIRSGCVGDPRVSGGKTYPIGIGWSGQIGGVLLEGGTLKETLLLNLAPTPAHDPALDLPAWERPPVTAAEEEAGGRAPTGLWDLHTWQARRVRLVHDGKHVVQVVLGNGEPVDAAGRQEMEPHAAWRRSTIREKAAARGANRSGRPPASIYMPRIHHTDRLIWRGLPALLPALAGRHQDSDPLHPPRELCPAVLDHLGRVCDAGIVARSRTVAIHAIGMMYGPKGSTVADIVDDTLTLPAALTSPAASGFAQAVADAVHAAESAARIAGNYASDLIAAVGADGEGPRSREIEQIHERLDGPFRGWLLNVGTGLETHHLAIAWQRAVWTICSDAGQALTASIPSAAWAGRKVRGIAFTAAHAEARFWRELEVALPLGFDTKHVSV